MIQNIKHRLKTIETPATFIMIIIIILSLNEPQLPLRWHFIYQQSCIIVISQKDIIFKEILKIFE